MSNTVFTKASRQACGDALRVCMGVGTVVCEKRNSLYFSSMRNLHAPMHFRHRASSVLLAEAGFSVEQSL